MAEEAGGVNIILYPHEIRALLETGRVKVRRAIKPQPVCVVKGQPWQPRFVNVYRVRTGAR